MQAAALLSSHRPHPQLPRPLRAQSRNRVIPLTEAQYLNASLDLMAELKARFAARANKPSASNRPGP